jgi:hypothetical protein
MTYARANICRFVARYFPNDQRRCLHAPGFSHARFESLPDEPMPNAAWVGIKPDHRSIGVDVAGIGAEVGG